MCIEILELCGYLVVPALFLEYHPFPTNYVGTCVGRAVTYRELRSLSDFHLFLCSVVILIPCTFFNILTDLQRIRVIDSLAGLLKAFVIVLGPIHFCSSLSVSLGILVNIILNP